MSSSINPIKKIVIVGGGTSGWIAASMLSYHLKPELCEIHLVESDDLGTIGIGESTIPPVVRLIQNLGIDEKHFIQNTQACFKLGIKFIDWRQKNESYFHPFGVIGKRIGSHDFYQMLAQGNLARRYIATARFFALFSNGRARKIFLADTITKHTDWRRKLRCTSRCEISC